MGATVVGTVDRQRAPNARRFFKKLEIKQKAVPRRTTINQKSNMERSDKISNTKASVISNAKSGYDDIVPIQESEHVSLDFGEPQGGMRAPSNNIDDSHTLGEVGFSMSRSRV